MKKYIVGTADLFNNDLKLFQIEAETELQALKTCLGDAVFEGLPPNIELDELKEYSFEGDLLFNVIELK